MKEVINQKKDQVNASLSEFTQENVEMIQE